MPRPRLSTVSVVDAAIRLVDESGSDTLTLAAVARHTGVSTPSLYKHVRSLDALQQKISARATAELANALSTAISGRSGEDALGSLARAYRHYALTHPRRYPLTQRVPDPQDPEHLVAGEQAVRAVVAVLRGYGLHGDEAIDATRVARSALHGFVSLEIGGGFGLPQDVGRSFERLVRSLNVTLRNWGQLA